MSSTAGSLQAVPQQWLKSHLVQHLHPSDAEFSEIREFVMAWLTSELPAGNLKSPKDQKLAQSFANDRLRPAFKDVFDRAPTGAIGEAAPYGFVKWIAEVTRKERSKIAKRESTEPPILDKHASPSENNQVSVYTWVWYTMYHSNDLPSTSQRVTLDEMTRGAPVDMTRDARSLVNYVSLEQTYNCVRDLGIASLSQISLIPESDPSFQDLGCRNIINNDISLREALRCMLERKGRPLQIWVVDGRDCDLIEKLLSVSNPLESSTVHPTRARANPKGSQAAATARPSLIVKLKLPAKRSAKGLTMGGVVSNSEESGTCDTTPTKRSSRRMRKRRVDRSPSLHTDISPTHPSHSLDSSHDSDLVEVGHRAKNPMLDPDARDTVESSSKGFHGGDEEKENDKEVSFSRRLETQMLSMCEHRSSWDSVTAFLKIDKEEISPERVIDKIPTFNGALYQYQISGVWTNLQYCMGPQNGSIHADHMGLGKVDGF
ncbi:MAG: hypothetical protein Q9180_000496 [Flavoplaca navasiana]